MRTKRKRTACRAITATGWLLLATAAWPGPAATDPGGPTAQDTWAARATQPPTGPIARHYEPMVMNAEGLGPLWGKPFSRLRVLSFRNSGWESIPCQFDDRLPDNRLVFTSGPEANPQEGNETLDPADELIFMVRDAGERRGREQWPSEVDQGVEIMLEDPAEHTKAWVYVAHYPGSPPPADWAQLIVAGDTGPRYVGGSHLWQAKGITNVHGGERYKTVINEEIAVPTLAGGSGRNILDRMKYRIEVRFLFGLFKLKLDENNVIGEVSQYRQGPLRLAVRNWAQIVLPAHLKSPKIWAEVYLFETFTIVPVRIRVPINPDVVLTDFRMSMGYDLDDHAVGMAFYNSNNLLGFTVDGVPSPAEKAMDTGLDDWRCVTGPQGSILTYSVWDEAYRRQAGINVYYVDDRETDIPPEGHPGQMGYFYNESVIKDLAPREYTLCFYVCFPPHFHDPAGLRLDLLGEYLDLKRAPVRAVIDGQTQVNRVAVPETMWPRVE